MKNELVRFYHSIDLPTTPDNASWAPHLHNDYEILFVYSVENAYFNISGSKYQLKSFDLVFINPALIHNLTIPYNQDYERCGLYFSENAIPKELKPAIKSFSYFYHLKDKSNPLFKIIFERIFAVGKRVGIQRDVSITRQIFLVYRITVSRQ